MTFSDKYFMMKYICRCQTESNKQINIISMKNKQNFTQSIFSGLITGLMFLSGAVTAEASVKKSSMNNAPVFSGFKYEGNDNVYREKCLNDNEFYSVILQGCYPDPSICRKGEDYYLVCSSFAMFPGVPIFHSKDLVNWTQMGHVLDRESQLAVEDCGISAGVYAPAIRYNKYNDTFYMITTQFSGGFGNMLVKTDDPAKGWSDPYKLNFEGIDPSMFFDEDGKAYIVHNDAPAEGETLYSGHRIIKIWEYDLEKDQVIAGTDKMIVNGGVDISKKPDWIEAPHIYKKNGKYYLMCAEGGTGDNHSEVIFTSDNIKGPYVPAPGNPILSQRHLPANRSHKMVWAGHADLVEGPDGNYYGVFLGIRPNEAGRVNTGRETLILPVDWTGEYPVFENGLLPIEPKLRLPEGVANRTGEGEYFPNGNFCFNENFSSDNLDYRWIGLRGPREKFVNTTKNGLKVSSFATNLKEVKPTSTLFHRQQHTGFSASVDLDFKPKNNEECAGMTFYQSEKFHYLFGITRQDKDYVIFLERVENGKSTLIASENIDMKSGVRLNVEAKEDKYVFGYSTKGSVEEVSQWEVSGDILSTNVAGGFTGCLIGLYATTANDVKF